MSAPASAPAWSLEMDGLLLRGWSTHTALATLARELDVSAEAVIARCQEFGLSVPLPWRSLAAEPKIGAVLNTVAQATGLTVEALTGGARVKSTAQARMVAAYCLSRCTGLSLKGIGLVLGGRDHTTIKHALNRVEGSLANHGPMGDLAERMLRACGEAKPSAEAGS